MPTEETLKKIQEQDTANSARAAKALEASYTGTGFVVAKGKGGLACPRGIVDEGQPISELDFADAAAFQARMKEGYIVADPNKPAEDKAKK